MSEIRMGVPDMNHENIAKLLRYEEIKISIKNLEEELNHLKPVIISLVPEGSVVQGKFGEFSLIKRSTYEYSPDIERLEDRLKEEKKDEVRKGIAVAKETVSVMYKEKQVKESEEDEV